MCSLLLDNVSKEKRSKIMSSIKGKNTRPEIAVRKILWTRGLRYRIHDRTVFGTPDISNKSRRFAVFVDGCFWHGCPRCYKEPRSNVSYWQEKIIRNKKRRTLVKKVLKRRGWKIFEFWEHQVYNDPEKIATKVINDISQKE